MKKSTSNRRSQSVSTVKKSHSRIAAACWRRNSRQLTIERLGAGSIPCRWRTFQTPLDDSGIPSATSSPWMRLPPARVLRRQTQNQPLRLRDQWRPARPTPIVCPAAPNEGTMPAQQRRRLHQERARPRRQLTKRREQNTIGRSQARPPDLPAQHLQLVPQDQDLELLRPLRPTKEDQQLEQTTNDPV